jgi:hypothetical protein
VPGDPLKHCFLDLTEVAFCAAQNVENEFAGPGDPLKQSILDLAKVAI